MSDDDAIATLDNKIADLEAENEALKQDKAALKERVKVGCSHTTQYSIMSYRICWTCFTELSR